MYSVPWNQSVTEIVRTQGHAVTPISRHARKGRCRPPRLPREMTRQTTHIQH